MLRQDPDEIWQQIFGAAMNAGLQDGALEGVSTNEYPFGYTPSECLPMIGQVDNSPITGGHLALLLQEWADAEVS
jgi:hypothetical protein